MAKMPINTVKYAAVLGLWLGAAGATLAADAAYVGTWGMAADQCKLPQDAEGAPFLGVPPPEDLPVAVEGGQRLVNP